MSAKLNLIVCALALALGVAQLLAAHVARAEDTDRMLSAYIAAVNANMPPRNNPEALAQLFTEDGAQIHPFGEPPGGPHRGRKAIAEFFVGFDGLSTWTHVEKSRLVGDSRAVWEGVAQGIHKESGKPLRLPIVFFLEFARDGKVKEVRVYFDSHMIAEQLK